jgi:hypothetical protein
MTEFLNLSGLGRHTVEQSGGNIVVTLNKESDAVLFLLQFGPEASWL